jgi:DDE domain
MSQISYSGYRFPPDVIQRAVWLYLRFTLGLRDVEDILAEPGIDVRYETIRCWVDRIGPQIAGRIRATRSKPTSKWRLDEMFVSVRGRQMYLWRAIDDEGEVPEVLLTSKRAVVPVHARGDIQSVQHRPPSHDRQRPPLNSGPPTNEAGTMYASSPGAREKRAPAGQRSNID